MIEARATYGKHWRTGKPKIDSKKSLFGF